LKNFFSSGDGAPVGQVASGLRSEHDALKLLKVPDLKVVTWQLPQASGVAGLRLEGWCVLFGETLKSVFCRRSRFIVGTIGTKKTALLVTFFRETFDVLQIFA
jgi:hypothetical protein